MAIEAVIFDMDGVLVDSEELWRRGEAEVFQALGVPMTAEMGRLTMGLRVDEVVEYWYTRTPWSGRTKAGVEAEINQVVNELVRHEGVVLPGAIEAVAMLHAAGYPLAIASSSTSELINIVVDKLGVRGQIGVLQSAEHQPLGKPHPGVYIEAARRLGIATDRCLAIEDSPAGLLAAKAARMQCIVVPAADMREDKRFCIADGQLQSLTELSLELVASL